MKTPFEEAMEWGLKVPCLCDPKDKMHICPTKATNILANASLFEIVNYRLRVFYSKLTHHVPVTVVTK